MAQHDYVIDNATGANVRADLNNVLQAIATNNSGSSDPSTTVASQFFADTNAGIMKLRNTSNNGFVNLFTLAGGIDVDAASTFSEDVTFEGASANIIFDKSTDDLIFNDNAKAIFGTSSDGLEIFHNASDSIINDNGTGSLKLQLGGSTKAEVVSGGFTVTGELDATTLDINGNAHIDGTLTLTNNLILADNDEILVGTGNDLQIFHNSTDSIIKNITGELKIQSDNFQFLTSDGSEKFADFNGNGNVELYFNNSKKYETSNDGSIFTGAVLIGTSSVHSTGKVLSITGADHIMEIQNTSTAGHRTITLRHSRASGGTDAEQIVFEEAGGGAVGSIQSNGSSTSYNTSSDYRLKENVVAISDGITRLKTLKPSRFNFKVDKDTTVDGFLAHEVTAVPEAITGTKDEVDSDNNPVYQGIDQSKLVPLLVAAVQELIGKVEALEAS